MRLKTAYSVGDIPHGEHPAPQRQREDFIVLNGKWDLKKLDIENKENFSGKVLVPFSPETLNGGIEEFKLNKGEKLIYSRSFTVDKEYLTKKAVLHFGAVDSECKVTLNGKLLGAHRCGFTPFSFEVSDALILGENSLTVEVVDEATRNSYASGKQSDKHGEIWYTPQSGIWQTVWLEFMPKVSVDDIKITPSKDEKRVDITFNCAEEVTVSVFDYGNKILSATGKNSLSFTYDFEFWSPENPKLYDLVFENKSGDKVKSYFGYRYFSTVTDKKGKKRFALNGKSYFFNGVLDQGYWSDGLLTYPTDEAAIDELNMLKSMGFNTVRKHIKVEPLRWYYHCDRIGLIVWQDFVNGGDAYVDSHIRILPFLGFMHRDDDYKYFSRQDKDGREEYLEMAKDIIDTLYNCVSVGLYVPFNEGWGQFDSKKITDMVSSLDGTRLIDSVSGWHDQGKENTPVKSLHTYYTPLKVPKDERVVVLSEFGGYSMKVDGHVFNQEKEFGYKKFKSSQKFIAAIEKLYLKKLLPLIEKGLCAAIYTQVSDVEEEINGLVTFDRKVIKIPVEKMKEINDKLFSAWGKIE